MMATVALGIIAIILGIAFEEQNIAFMVGLAFAIATSANFPLLFYLSTGRSSPHEVPL